MRRLVIDDNVDLIHSNLTLKYDLQENLRKKKIREKIKV